MKSTYYPLYIVIIIFSVALALTFSCQKEMIEPSNDTASTSQPQQRKAITCVSEVPTAITFKSIGVALADGSIATFTTLSVAATTNTCYESILYKLTNKRTGATTYEPAQGVDQNKISVNIFSYPTIIGGVFSAVGDTLTVSAASTTNVNLFTPITAYSTPVTYVIPQK